MRRLLFILCFPVSAFAQTFVAEAPLPEVKADGFYLVPLSAGVTAYATPGMANFRILNAAGQEVPFIVREETPEFNSVQFKQYTIEKSQQPGCCTMITLLNKEAKSINNISFEVKNAETIKEARILGSDDRKQWYALREKFPLYSFDSPDNTSEMRVIDFPLSNYNFYQVVINDSTTAPLNILKAGYYDVAKEFGGYNEIAGLKLTTADSAKEHITWVRIKLDTIHAVDKLEIVVNGPPFYHRDATLYVKDFYWSKKKKVEYLTAIQNFDVTSRHGISLRLSSLQTDEILVAIRNENNPPLSPVSATAFQLKRSLVAYMSKGTDYKLKIGSDSLQAPVYDLAFFADKIPDKPESLELGAVTRFAKAAVGPQSTTIFTNRNIIWVAIGLIVVVLGSMSVRMMREVKSK